MPGDYIGCGRKHIALTAKFFLLESMDLLQERLENIISRSLSPRVPDDFAFAAIDGDRCARHNNINRVFRVDPVKRLRRRSREFDSK